MKHTVLIFQKSASLIHIAYKLMLGNMDMTTNISESMLPFQVAIIIILLASYSYLTKIVS